MNELIGRAGSNPQVKGLSGTSELLIFLQLNLLSMALCVQYKDMKAFSRARLHDVNEHRVFDGRQVLPTAWRA